MLRNHLQLVHYVGGTHQPITGLGKKHEFHLLGTSSSLKLFFFYSVDRRFAWALAHRASKIEKLLAQKENLVVPDNGIALFSSPESILQCH